MFHQNKIIDQTNQTTGCSDTNIPTRSRILTLVMLVLVLLILILFSACDKGSNINRFMSERHCVILADLVRDDCLIQNEEQVINNISTEVTRFHFVPDDIDKAAGMAQKMELNKNHRLTGISFHLRSLSGKTEISPALVSHNINKNHFLYSSNIKLESSKWQEVILTFNNFADTGSQMYLDIDTFFPGEHDTISLLLIPYENIGKDQVIEWGPVKAIYQDKRYRFY